MSMNMYEYNFFCFSFNVRSSRVIKVSKSTFVTDDPVNDVVILVVMTSEWAVVVKKGKSQ